MANVTVQIQGATPVSVGWTQGMTVLQALEGVFNQAGGKFAYAVSYAGSAAGYLVTMINGTVDTPLISSGPFFFWVFSVNNTPSSTGNVSGTTLNSGDAVSFAFQQFGGSGGAKSALSGKYNLLTKGPEKKKR